MLKHQNNDAFQETFESWKVRHFAIFKGLMSPEVRVDDGPARDDDGQATEDP